jgi:hypothetical protein
MRKCELCGADYSYIIQNPIKAGEVAICEADYNFLEMAKATAYKKMLEHKFYNKTREAI